MKSDETVTIYDVAREAAVSMATVSRVVNGNPNVKAATREKVMKVIKDLDYRPNAVARGLASKKTTTIGLVIPNIANSYFSRLAYGIDDIAKMYHYDIILSNGGEDEAEMVNSLFAKQVDGIIYMSYHLTDEVRAILRQSRIPVVLAGTLDVSGELPSVNIDYEKATIDVVNALAKNNQHIAFISGPMNYDINNRIRLEGYKKALEENHLSFDESLIFEGSYNYESGYALSEQIVQSKASAAYVSEDDLAAGILNGLQDKGVSIPEEFEVITNNDSAVVQFTHPNLSSINQPLYDLGAISMRMLTKLMQKESIETKTILLDHTITYRQSTKNTD